MKKTRVMLLLLALTLTLGALPAQAAEKPLTMEFTGPVTLTEGKSAVVLKTKVNSTESGVISYKLVDNVDKNKPVVFEQTVENVKAGDAVEWTAPYYAADMSNSKPTKQLRATFTMDGKTYTFNLYYNYSAKKGEAPQVIIERASYYPNNTACSFGPQFRVVSPEKTDKWYMFTPVDLTIQGRQEFEYVASNMYIIGKVYVDVAGDSVTVTYHNYYADQGGNTETISEFFTFFPDYASVGEVEPEKMGVPGFTFGQALSIENDLAGDTNVLLFVRNRVNYLDYVTKTKKLTRFWPNIPERKALREDMLALMQRQ